MMTHDTFLFLVSITFRATALLVVVWSLSLFARTAAQKHFCWACGLLGVLALPLLYLSLPEFEAAAGPLAVAAKGERSVVAGAQRLTAEPITSAGPAPAFDVSATVPAESQEAANSEHSVSKDEPSAAVTASGVSPSPETNVGRTAVPASGSSIDWPRPFVCAWLVGCGLLILRILVAWIRLLLVFRAGTESASPFMVPLFELAGIQRPVQLVTSPACRMPMTWGLFRPIIVVPAGFDGWSETEQRTTLHHELTHIKRCDAFWQFLSCIVCALHWFNPLVWIASRRLMAQAELAVDDRVLSGGSSAADYAELLTRVVAGPARSSALATSMARKSGFETRVERILKAGVVRSALGVRSLTVIVLVVLGLVVPLAAMQSAGSEGTQDGLMAEGTADKENVPAETEVAGSPQVVQAAKPFAPKQPDGDDLPAPEDLGVARTIGFVHPGAAELREQLLLALRLTSEEDQGQWENLNDFLEQFLKGVRRDAPFSWRMNLSGAAKGTLQIPIEDLEEFRNGIRMLGILTVPVTGQQDLYEATDAFEGWMKLYPNQYAVFSAQPPVPIPTVQIPKNDMTVRLQGGQFDKRSRTARMKQFETYTNEFVADMKKSTPIARDLSFLGLTALRRAYSDSLETTATFDLERDGSGTLSTVVRASAGSELADITSRPPAGSRFAGLVPSDDSLFHLNTNMPLDQHRRRFLATVAGMINRHIQDRMVDGNLTAAEQSRLVPLMTVLTQSIARPDGRLDAFVEAYGTRGDVDVVVGLQVSPEPVTTLLNTLPFQDWVFEKPVAKVGDTIIQRVSPGRGVDPFLIATSPETVWFASDHRSEQILRARIQESQKPKANTGLLSCRMRLGAVLELVGLSERTQNWTNDRDVVELSVANPMGTIETTVKGSTRVIGEWLARVSKENLAAP